MVPQKLIPIFAKDICCFGSQFTVGDLNTSCSFDHEYHSPFYPVNELTGYYSSIPLHNPAACLDIHTSWYVSVRASALQAVERQQRCCAASLYLRTPAALTYPGEQ